MSCVKVKLLSSRFERLVVTEESGRDKFGEVLWKCQCDCGQIRVIRSSALRKGKHKSCGCLKTERIGNDSRTHGGSTTPEYPSYRAMLRRCNDPKHRAYPWYGARGIKVCLEWQTDFAKFSADMGPRPSGWTLDRIDSNRDYEPSNCRWAPWSVQGINKRRRLPSLPALG